MESVTPGPQKRRQRQRAETTAEIKDAARALLVEAGPSGISLRAIARNMGVSAAGLYRYFPSLEALITQLCADLYTELGDHMQSQCDALPDTSPVNKLRTAARAFRGWAVTHRSEFTLMFASLAPGSVIAGPETATSNDLDPEAEPYRSMLAFSRVFGAIFDEAFRQSDSERGFSLKMPQTPPLTPQLQTEIVRCSLAIGVDVPLAFGYVLHSFWIRLYGLVAMEVFGQLPVVGQGEALLEAEMAIMAGQLGVDVDQLHTHSSLLFSARMPCPTLVRHLPEFRFHFHPCIWHVNTPSSILPKRDRSAFKCGHRRCTVQPCKSMFSSSGRCSAYQPSA